MKNNFDDVLEYLHKNNYKGKKTLFCSTGVIEYSLLENLIMIIASFSKDKSIFLTPDNYITSNISRNLNIRIINQNMFIVLVKIFS